MIETELAIDPISKSVSANEAGKSPEDSPHTHDVATLVKLSKTHYSTNEYDKAIETAQHILKFQPNNIDALNILSYSYFYKNEEKHAIEYCTKWIESTIENPSIPLAVLNKIYQKKAQREERARIEGEYARSIEQAKLDERNKIIADLSHSIKNLLSTVIDPLENLKQSAAVTEKRIIENALRGTNLVREIVNGMNLSSKGSIYDFYHDAQHNEGQNARNIKTILLEALRSSVANMFDGKYFSNFMRKYFPSREYYLEAKLRWEQESSETDAETVIAFLQDYFFDSDILWDGAERLVIGNDKGSATKLLILFQEIILNAVKYSAFVERQQREFKVHFSNDTKQIKIRVQNRFNPESRVKTSGIGHVIVENFAERMNATSEIQRCQDIYSIELILVNFWEKTPL